MSNLSQVGQIDFMDIGLKKRRISLFYQMVKTFFSNGALAVLMFLFIYNLSFIAAPSLTTGRLTILLLTWLLFAPLYATSRRFVSENLLSIFIFVFILIHSFFLYILNGSVDSVQLSRAFHFLAYSIFGSLLFSTLLNRNLYRFVSAFSLATLIQSLFIFYSYFSSEYRLWLSELLVQGGNIPLTYEGQVPGFSNSSGALLSIVQALGVFSALYSARLSKSFFKICFYYLAALLIITSTLVTGRTGLLLSVAFIILFMLTDTKKLRSILLIILAIALLTTVLFGGRLYFMVSQYNPNVESLRSWPFEFYQHGFESVSLKDLASQPIPPLSLETILGTGLVAAIDGEGNASGNDSGYIQTYYALGLIMASIFYGAMFAMLMKYWCRSADRFLLGGLILLMFVVELKEPFIYKYVYPFFALSFTYTSSKQKDSVKTPKYETQDLSPDLRP